VRGLALVAYKATADGHTRFTDTEKWRSEFGGGVDNLTRTFDYKEKPQVFKYYPQYYHKTDKEGRPVYIEQLGNIDLEALRKITTDDRMLSNLVCEYEKLADPRLPAASRKANCLLETCCTIMDMKGVGLGKAGQVYGYLQRASGISQNNYPERLGKLYIINAPWGFSGVFAVIKRFLDPVTVNKIHVLGSGYKSELLSQVPKENLPKEFGGDCHCEGGCQLSDAGPCKCCLPLGDGDTGADDGVQGKIRNGQSRRSGPPTTTSQRLRAILVRVCPLVDLAGQAWSSHWGTRHRRHSRPGRCRSLGRNWYCMTGVWVALGLC